MSGDPRPPRIKLASLGEYVSQQSGRSWFSGFAGPVKYILLAEPDQTPSGKSVGTWNLYVEPAPPRSTNSISAHPNTKRSSRNERS